MGVRTSSPPSAPPRVATPGTTIAAIAVVSGAFLAGAMFCITLLTVPLIVDTTPSTAPQELLDRWVRLYHYGHRMMPGLAVGTCLLYALAVRRGPQHRRALTGAGVATGLMLPFTWFVMTPTNSALFAAQAAGHGGVSILTWDESMHLLTRWTWLHSARSMMPLTGAALGMWATALELGSAKVGLVATMPAATMDADR